MAREGTCNITDVSPATDNFKTNEDLKNSKRRFGTNMSGKGRPSLISKRDLREAETGLRKLWIMSRLEKVQMFCLKKSFAYLTLHTSERIFF